MSSNELINHQSLIRILGRYSSYLFENKINHYHIINRAHAKHLYLPFFKIEYSLMCDLLKTSYIHDFSALLFSILWIHAPSVCKDDALNYI